VYEEYGNYPKNYKRDKIKIMPKQEVFRSTELFITHTCGAKFSWIPNEDLDKVNVKNPLRVKCPKCASIVIIYEITE